MPGLIAQTSSSPDLVFIGMIAGAVLAAVVGVVLMRRWDPDKIDDVEERRRARQTRVKVQAGVVVVVVIVVLGLIVLSPADTDVRNALLGLYGVLITAIIGLTATTHVGNALAGLILSSRGSFGDGDFIRSGDLLGRVTDQRFLHTEIQTEDSDLTLIPNLRLVTEPVTVMRRKEGTFVSSEVSLGYDVHRSKAKGALLEAVRAAELEDPLVLISDLGDFSVTYRAGGKLPKATTFISARSTLREQILDHLHASDIEIVSPAFMNQRLAKPGGYIPDAPEVPVPTDEASTYEEVVFDKAESLESINELKSQRSQVREEIEAVRAQIATAADEAALGRAKDRLSKLEQTLRRLDQLVDEVEHEPSA